MDVYAPIDIRNGRCVQLVQGDFNRETIFFDKPVDAAKHWVDQGADWLHVVDLDGARDGASNNADLIAAIIEAAGLTPVQVAGGIRLPEHVASMIEKGAARIVLGTVVVRDPGIVAGITAAYPDQVGVAIDARHGRAVTDGWLANSEVSVQTVAERAVENGASAVIYTDVVVEGMLNGPNIKGTRTLVEQIGNQTPVIASGGVTTVQDVVRLRDAGASGVIIGSALYRCALSIAEARTATQDY